MYSWTRFLMIFVLGIPCLGLVACQFPPRIYKMDIRQGNDVTPEMIHALRKGMSKEQVQDILGTPTLQHTFNTERWDYYYCFKSGVSAYQTEKHFTVFFQKGRLSSWQ